MFLIVNPAYSLSCFAGAFVFHAGSFGKSQPAFFSTNRNVLLHALDLFSGYYAYSLHLLLVTGFMCAGRNVPCMFNGLHPLPFNVF